MPADKNIRDKISNLVTVLITTIILLSLAKPILETPNLNILMVTAVGIGIILYLLRIFDI